MIRKVLFSIALIFTVFWFSGAYLIKNRLISMLDNLESDNIKVSYDKISMSGFPGIWKISIKNPRFTLIDSIHLKQISTASIDCLVDFTFKKMTLVISDTVHQDQDIDQVHDRYTWQADQNILARIKFNSPLYEVGKNDSVSQIIKSFNLYTNRAVGIFEGKEICAISNIAIEINKLLRADSESSLIKAHARYTGEDAFLGFNEAELTLDLTVTYWDRLKPSRSININEFYLVVDDASASMEGEISLVAGRLPKGEFLVKVDNYEAAVDKIIPASFNVPKTTLKDVIVRAAEVASTEKATEATASTLLVQDKTVHFNVTFSEKGVQIGGVNLTKFNLD